MQDEISLRFNKFDAPFSIDYVSRKGKYSMATDHFHAQYEMYYLLSGERNYFIHNRVYPIQSGDLVLINTQELHKTTTTTGIHEHERLVFYFFESFLHSEYSLSSDFLLSSFHQGQPVYRFNASDQLKIKSIISTLMYEMKTKPLGYEICMKHSLIELLLHAARHERTQNPIPQHMNTPLHLKISDIAQHISQHFNEDIGLNELSKHFYISSYYLSRTFKEVTGFTLTEYINLIRIKEAQKLLYESKLSITEIAAAVGFENFSHFGKMFKKITRLTPREYRNKH